MKKQQVGGFTGRQGVPLLSHDSKTDNQIKWVYTMSGFTLAMKGNYSCVATVATYLSIPPQNNITLILMQRATCICKLEAATNN